MGHRAWLATFLLTLLLVAGAGEVLYRLAGCFSLTACRAADVEAGVYDHGSLALFGSSVSHHALGTTPRLYGPVANLTTVGATTLAGDLALLRRLLGRGVPLRSVVLLATPEMFGYRLTAEDERRRTYFTNVFDRPEETALFVRLSGADADRIATSAPQRALESRRAFLADARNMWRLVEARQQDGAAAPLAPDAQAARPGRPEVDAGQAARAAARSNELAGLELPNADSRAVLRALEEECARRALRCVVGLEPIQESVYARLAASGQLAALHDAVAGLCWIDLNQPSSWPDGAFEDVVHLSAGPWTAHYRSLLLALAARLAAPSDATDDPCGDAAQASIVDGIARR